MSNYVVDNILGNIGYSIYQKRSKLVDKINLLLAKLIKNVRFSTAKNMEDKAISMSKKNDFSGINVIITRDAIALSTNYLAIGYINNIFNELDKDTNIYLDYINQIDNKTKNNKNVFQPLEEYINELNDAINNIPKIAKKESSIKYPVTQFTYTVQDIIDNIKRVDKALEVLYRKMNICIKAYNDCSVSRTYAIKIYNIFISYMNIAISLLDRQLDQLLKAYEKIINHDDIEISEAYHDLYTTIKFL